ncbi:hypothetical protein SD71_11750 [Cohnella kolymensis]|uniref:Uncharacterized protein n=1 Tax=Cohnella kolymensis TaxID=1590652 RepID=A0ABR5A611_9BACL|nr:hypothetical protein SD71_11750 [Cohnella kolymensis]
MFLPATIFRGTAAVPLSFGTEITSLGLETEKKLQPAPLFQGMRFRYTWYMKLETEDKLCNRQ